MLRSAEYDDIYFNQADGIGESNYVFLHGCDIPVTWHGQPHCHLTELGFGTGLNFLLTLDAWQRAAQSNQHLTYTGIDLHPLPPSQLIEIYHHWPQLPGQDLLSVYPSTDAGMHVCYPAKNVTLMLLWGEVLPMLQAIKRKQNIFFLDGFAPHKNSAMWRDEIYPELARIAAPDARLATFTAAGHVKRGLESAGFTVTKTHGFGNKRERITARYAS